LQAFAQALRGEPVAGSMPLIRYGWILRLGVSLRTGTVWPLPAASPRWRRFDVDNMDNDQRG